MKPWPKLRNETITQIADVLRYMIGERTADRREWLDLPNEYIKGRKVAKVPTSSSDVTGSREGDFNYDGSYLYVCVNNAGSVVWRRVVLSSW
jgi:hypothetical protein